LFWKINVDWEIVRRPRSKAVRIASSHLITSCATIAALFLFVALGSQVVPGAFGWAQLGDAADSLSVAFILNIAIILFGWRRSKDLREALDAHEEAERAAQRNANTDPTTGLANRRELMRALDEALEARRGGVLLLLDLDHFKRVNDLHGHLAGDQLLKMIAENLTRTAADAACVARIGGDEFALLAPGAGASGVLRLLRDLREAIETSATYAAAMVPEDARTPGELVACADARLLAQKRDVKRREALR
jgi:diguanylate cyclase (GGDEF)-like protein